jgi:hypothetical protein
MAMKIEGLEQLQRELQELSQKVEALAGEREVSLSELFPDEFMLLHTDFDSIDSMFEASSFTITSQEDFAAIPDDQWDTCNRSASNISF